MEFVIARFVIVGNFGYAGKYGLFYWGRDFVIMQFSRSIYRGSINFESDLSFSLLGG